MSLRTGTGLTSNALAAVPALSEGFPTSERQYVVATQAELIR